MFLLYFLQFYNRLFFSGVQRLCLAILFFSVNCDFIKVLVLLSSFWPAVYFVSTSLVYLSIFLLSTYKQLEVCYILSSSNLQAWACVLLFVLVDFICFCEDVQSDSDSYGHHYPPDQESHLPIFSMTFCYNTCHIRSMYFFLCKVTNNICSLWQVPSD